MLKLNNGNTKTGKNTQVFNLPPVTTCRKNAPCIKTCYARRYYNRYPAVKTCYNNNLEYVKTHSRTDVQTSILEQIKPSTKYLRWFASGDIPSIGFLLAITTVARKTPHIKHWLYTKQYELVNSWLDLYRFFPDNLTVIFSEWQGLEFDNPHNLPIAYFNPKNGSYSLRDETDEVFNCTIGDCSKCKICFDLKPSQAVQFNEH